MLETAPSGRWNRTVEGHFWRSLNTVCADVLVVGLPLSGTCHLMMTSCCCPFLRPQFYSKLLGGVVASILAQWDTNAESAVFVHIPTFFSLRNVRNDQNPIQQP